MRRELWGLRVKTTREPVYTYWASSNRHRALFARREEAEKACLNPMNKDIVEASAWPFWRGYGAVQDYRRRREGDGEAWVLEECIPEWSVQLVRRVFCL